MVPQIIVEKPVNISSILINFKSFIKEVYQEHGTQTINKKKYQNNYFRAEISQKEEKIFRVKVKKKIDF